MQKQIQIENIGLVTYVESFWTGKKQITVNGQEATKTGKNTFLFCGNTLTVVGGFLTGIAINANGQNYTVTEKTRWYEYILAFLPLFLDLVWGNSPSLVALFPIVGGAIGGAVCGLAAILQIAAMKAIKKPICKVLVSLAITVATVAVLFVLAVIMVAALA